jgi:hypothetical protein
VHQLQDEIDLPRQRGTVTQHHKIGLSKG